MLVPAISKETELIDKFAVEIYTYKYFWFCGYPYYNRPPEIKAEDGFYQYAIVNSDEEVVGYLAYRIDTYTDCAQDFGLYSFGDGDVTVGMDVLAKLNELVSQHRRVEWNVVGDNKATKMYERFCTRHGGSVVRLTDAVRDSRGKYHDWYIFEIVKGGDQ